MNWFTELPIRRKLLWIVGFAVAVAGIVTAGVLAVYESSTFQPRIVSEVRADAQMMAEMIEPAIEFDDADTVGKQLATLQRRPGTRAAAVFLADGRRFATYRRSGANDTPLELLPPGPRQRFERDTVWVVEPVVSPVVSRGSIIGYVWLLVDLPPLSQRLNQYVAVAGASACSLLVLAALLALTLRRAISGPLHTLMQTAHGVSARKDYSLRASVAARDEFGQLATAFNEMLATIEERNQAQLAREARLALQNQGLVDLARAEQQGAGDLAGELRAMTEIVARVHEVERTSLWFFLPDRAGLRCEDLYERSTGRHRSGMELFARDYPAYFAAIAEERVVAVEDILTDPRTSGLGGSYLQPNRIGALLEVPVRWRGRIVGILSHEHIGSSRRWHPDELSFAVSSSDRVALVLEADELHKAESALRESEESYRNLIADAQDAIFTLSVNGLIEDVNHAGSRITGWDHRKWIGQRFQRVLFADDVPLAEERVAEVIAGGHPPSFELRIRARNGALVTLEFALSPLVRKGRVVGVMGVGRDVTERKASAQAQAKLETQLQQAQKMDAIGTLAGGIAHDFNNILTGILGNTQLATMDLPADHPVQDWLQRVLQASQRAKDLVNQILTFSRRQEPRRAPLQLQTVIEEALKLLRPSLPSSIEIHTELPAASPPVLADSTQLHQVLMNLATNAAHAMGETGGRLDIRQDLVEVDEDAVRQRPQLRCGRFVRLAVSDTGCGMDAATVERIFEPFFTTKAQGTGTGLGLSVVLGIVQQHEGAIFVYSEPGIRTTFQIYLPVCGGGSTVAPTSAESRPPRGQGERVMVVDDEEIVVQVSAGVLERLGYRVTAFKDPEAALLAFKEQPLDYDLVVTDLTMPRMKGTVLAAEMRRLNPALPIVLCTGFGGALNRSDTALLELHGPLLKPFTMEALARVVAEALQSRRVGETAPAAANR